MENIEPTSETSVDESQVYSLPELNARDPKQEVVQPATPDKAVTDKEKIINPLLLVFWTMILAKRVLREGDKETKNSNRLYEIQWESISQEQQNEHKKTAASQKNLSHFYVIGPALLIFGWTSGQWLANKDPDWIATVKTQTECFSNSFPTWAQNVTLIVPMTVGSILDSENKPKKMEDLSSSLSGLVTQTIQTNSEGIRLENEGNQALIQMKSQSASTLYHNRSSEESSNKQQIFELDRSGRDLMNQESQVYLGSSGRG